MSQWKMQAVSSTDGKLYPWLVTAPDFAGTFYDGPGAPLHIAIASRPSGSAGAGNSGRKLAGIVYVDPTFSTGTSDGTQDKPYFTCSDALVANPGDVTLLLASGTYDEPPFEIDSTDADNSFRDGRSVRIQAISQSGQAAVFVNKPTWAGKDNDLLELSGLVMLSGLGLKDGGAGTSDCYLFVESCQFPGSAGITNQNPAAGAYSHRFNVSAFGRILDPPFADMSVTGDMVISGAVEMRGTLTSEKTYFAGALTGATKLQLRDSGIGHSSTWSGDAVCYSTFFVPGVTITQAGGAHLYADRLTKYYLNSIVYTGGGAIVLLD